MLGVRVSECGTGFQPRNLIWRKSRRRRMTDEYLTSSGGGEAAIEAEHWK